jgi:nucleotide-binding universal stress UspA family protein
MDVTQVVVGVDGSEPSAAAVQWAARDANRRNAELVITHAFDWRVQGSRVQVAGGYREAVQEAAGKIVDTAVTQALVAEPGLRVSPELTVGRAAPALVDRSTEDTLVVVGNRGRGGFSSLLLGSVSQQVATHAGGPVAVVRGRADAATGAVVVGVDGPAEPTQTLGAAFDEAARRGARLLVVYVSSATTPPWNNVAPYVDDDGVEELVAARETLAQEIEPWTAKYPDVVVEAVALGGHPAEVLIDLSRTAQLIIVGTRGSGGFAGLLLGAVSQQLLHHADCPVLIIPSQVEAAAS